MKKPRTGEVTFTRAVLPIAVGVGAGAAAVAFWLHDSSFSSRRAAVGLSIIAAYFIIAGLARLFTDVE